MAGSHWAAAGAGAALGSDGAAEFGGAGERPSPGRGGKRVCGPCSRRQLTGAGGRRSMSPFAPQRARRRCPDTDAHCLGEASRGWGQEAATRLLPPPPWAPSQSPEALGSCSLPGRAADGVVPREGAKGDMPAASSRPSPERLREQAPSPGAGRRAGRESCSARTQRQGAA
ncbi:uncharacterized protein LOC108582520 [Papio anubis]|uniref:uncharacterized protein LOC108582520 n=1 Tax=Papio anubis TaxID=9555 RepID=UPI0012AE59D5|nr:uncharacterized protein LOC108582520 [Papio anubis]